MLLAHVRSGRHAGFAAGSPASHADRVVMKVWVSYGLAVFVYILITFFTKRLLSWNLALLYFVTTLEILPRAYRRLRPATSPPAALAAAGSALEPEE
jgi:hypothetical protein